MYHTDVVHTVFGACRTAWKVLSQKETAGLKWQINFMVCAGGEVWYVSEHFVQGMINYSPDDDIFHFFPGTSLWVCIQFHSPEIHPYTYSHSVISIKHGNSLKRLKLCAYSRHGELVSLCFCSLALASVEWHWLISAEDLYTWHLLMYFLKMCLLPQHHHIDTETGI